MHALLHIGMALLGSAVFPELLSTGFAVADFFYILPPPDCSDSNKMKQRIEFENKLFS